MAVLRGFEAVTEALDAEDFPMDKQALAVWGVLQPALRRFGIAHVDVTIHEVVNDMNVVLDVELPHSAFS